tara:strand:- start:745 stop:912 length:168 start_codon:yes stop_codon:yes gene_type:complete
MTEAQRIIAIETQNAPTYWDAVGDYAAQIDAGKIGEQKAVRLVARALQDSIKAAA